MDYFIITLLIICSGLFSGLTLGYFSLNKNDLARKAELGDVAVKKVYQLRRRGNLLLCTLLIGNVAVNAALSIFLGSLTSGFTAGLVATFLIVVFGEIVPQAAFSRYALIFGSKLAGFTRLMLIVFYPITAPIAWVLDKILGDELDTIYSKKELIKLVEEHEDNPASDIDADEERIIKGALSFSEKKVKTIMTPAKKMVAISAKERISESTLRFITQSGHSRIPVYENNKNQVVGVLYVKDLIGKEIIGKTVGELARSQIIFVAEDKPLDDLLDDFKKTKNHLFIVVNKKGEVSGLVTIEDVLEEILGVEIVDEFDQNQDQPSYS